MRTQLWYDALECCSYLFPVWYWCIKISKISTTCCTVFVLTVHLVGISTAVDSDPGSVAWIALPIGTLPLSPVLSMLIAFAIMLRIP